MPAGKSRLAPPGGGGAVGDRDLLCAARSGGGLSANPLTCGGEGEQSERGEPRHGFSSSASVVLPRHTECASSHASNSTEHTEHVASGLVARGGRARGAAAIGAAADDGCASGAAKRGGSAELLADAAGCMLLWLVRGRGSLPASGRGRRAPGGDGLVAGRSA